MSLFQHPVFNKELLKNQRVLDIGCGRNKLPFSTGLDEMDLPGVDVVANLNERLPFDDASFDVVYSHQVFEHIPNLIGLIGEIHRILVPGGIMVASVPYFRSSYAAIDPTHVRQFTLQSMDYFVNGTSLNNTYRFTDTSFSKIERYLDNGYPASFLRWIFTSLAHRWPNRFENSPLSFLFPFEDLTFMTTK